MAFGFRRRLRLTLLAVLGLALAASGKGTVSITQCRVQPASVALGDSFELRVTATATGVSCLNFRIRTPYRAGDGDVPEGFAVESGRGYAVLRDHSSGNLMDNGDLDQDPEEGALAVQVDTSGLAEGEHYFVVFAHNRPAANEAHALDYRNLKLEVGQQRVVVTVLNKDAGSVREPVRFDLPDPIPAAGGIVSIGVRRRDGQGGPLGVVVRNPYTWDRDEVLPGFEYDERAKIGYLGSADAPLIRDGEALDASPEEGEVRIGLDTSSWPTGVHVLTIEVPEAQQRAPYGHTGAMYRDIQIDIPSPEDHLKVELSDPVVVAEGTHFSALISLGDGRVYTGGRLSEDGGQSWRAAPSMPRPNRLSDGSLIAMAYKAFPIPDQPGHYRGELYRSEDQARTVAGPLESVAIVPRARAALGHSLHVGPLFGRSIVERDDGSLLAGMYGWFEGDTQPDHYRAGGTMRRAYTCRSSDGGRTWTYLSSIAYEPFLGNEGYSEVVIRRIPDGSILALIRTGGNSNPGWQDNPLVVSRSTDEGASWSPVQRTGVEGVWPDLCVMSSGTLVCSTGRPGAFIMFSTDGGRTWTDHTAIDPERYSGYTAVCEVEPDVLLVGYGVRQGIDPDSGARRNMLKVVRVSVAEK